jgi:DNA-binding MarR family transcriptional regulator
MTAEANDPNRVLKELAASPELESIHVRLLLLLVCLGEGFSYSSPTNEVLAETLRVSTRYVSRLLSELVALKWIDVYWPYSDHRRKRFIRVERDLVDLWRRPARTPIGVEPQFQVGGGGGTTVPGGDEPVEEAEEEAVAIRDFSWMRDRLRRNKRGLR